MYGGRNDVVVALLQVERGIGPVEPDVSVEEEVTGTVGGAALVVGQRDVPGAGQPPATGVAHGRAVGRYDGKQGQGGDDGSRNPTKSGHCSDVRRERR